MEVLKDKKKVITITIDTGEEAIIVSGSPYPPEELKEVPLPEGFKWDDWTGSWFYSYPAAWMGADLTRYVREKVYEPLKEHSEAIVVILRRGVYTDVVEVWSKT